MINFKNKKILVTGATGGIGREIVKKFISLEGNVVATGTNIEKLDLLKKDFPTINVIKFDISDHSKIEEFIDNASSQLTGLDILINNGVTNFIEIGPGKVLSGLVKRIDKTINVNTINKFEDLKDIKLND